jgi:hypothetical protein
MDFCIDVTVINPLAETYFQKNLYEPLHAVMAAEERKMVQYVDACRLANLGFLPFGMTTLGAFTATSMKIMDRLVAGKLQPLYWTSRKQREEITQIFRSQ